MAAKTARDLRKLHLLFLYARLHTSSRPQWPPKRHVLRARHAMVPFASLVPAAQLFLKERNILNSQCPSTFTIHNTVDVLVHLLYSKLYLGCPFSKALSTQ
jgi:hypothetical protein